MPDFAGSKTQRAAGKYVCMASHPANTTVRLAAWTALQNYVLPFSQPCRQYSHVKHSTATSKLPSGASRPTHPAAYLSVPAPQSHASQQPSFRLDRPIHFRSHSFFFPSTLLFFPNKKRKPTSPVSISFSFFLQLQPKHLLRNLFHRPSRRPVSILFCTSHAMVIHECHQVTRILDFSLDFGNFLFFFFF